MIAECIDKHLYKYTNISNKERVESHRIKKALKWWGSKKSWWRLEQILNWTLGDLNCPFI